MSRSRVICAWIAVVAVLLSGPVGSLAECLRCPPDCPMHAAAVDARSTKPKKCHEASAPAPEPAPEPGDGPCLSGVCGHMDPSHARTLPDGVLGRPGPLAPVLVTELATPLDVGAPAAREVAPPTDPPRALSA